MSVLLDLGIRLLVLAAARAPDKVTIRETAASCAASHAHLAKAANRLVKGGFLCSLRGRRGGLKLALPPRRSTSAPWSSPCLVPSRRVMFAMRSS
ncbi:Rrf2 family transcriptional regulator (plasmid) [Rhizobium sp. BG6]|nr:Rrf2 family transcriptional regulator [Rhizobium sp. BG6]QRM52534.1 Rrf2 family transcriptional regulator [Rhizobium sp. BG6]